MNLFKLKKDLFSLAKIKPILGLIISVSFLLSGCVKYDLGVNFNSANNGELVQHIKLSDQLTSFSGDYIDEWLKSLQNRAKKLEGSAQRVSPEEIIIKIPFSSGKELQNKFSGFFNSHIDNQVLSDDELPLIISKLIVKDHNFLLLSRNRLIYDLDLRSMSMLTSKTNTLEGANSIINLDFSLQTPWGAKVIQQDQDYIQPEKYGNQLVWQLKPGESTHIEVVFWLPNFLGIGALLIIFFVWGGLYLRYTLMPVTNIEFASK
ncbi:DUF3153 domain-containing protein [Cronbergia sp. UHCC 0137]|uniref:DUF3153 domain-containing protein n=1 Tax=Cronbergia sp. UHCC 0137 TaxID=3110239 RepID=UPI002B216638|nr:DUF3153 domain-containing protein [Cronbergia sp. UHCC 0137]MEA5618391.1 DUF3153 domain-containing protein [Cronbergia sp. UHCC 0137]